MKEIITDFVKDVIADYLQAKYLILLIIVAVLAFGLGRITTPELTEQELIQKVDELMAGGKNNNKKSDFYGKPVGNW